MRTPGGGFGLADVREGGFGLADVCGQGGEGSKMAKILRTSFMDGPFFVYDRLKFVKWCQ